jgi:signal transduction histidine kinase
MLSIRHGSRPLSRQEARLEVHCPFEDDALSVSRYGSAIVRRVRRVWVWTRSHPLMADAVIAGVLLPVSLVSSKVELDNLQPGTPLYRSPSAAAVMASAGLLVAPLVWRRRAPLSALLACTAAILFARIALDGGDATTTAIVFSLAVYSAAAHGRARSRDAVCALCITAVMAELWREANVVFPHDMPNRALNQIFALWINVALFCAMWALGSALGKGRRRGAELLERTVELEREREENARRAVFEERVRIARELHDVVAHHVSMMGVQAGAARVVLDRDRGKATNALAAIETSSRQAVMELHRLLGFLRQAGDRDDLAPQPGLAQLAQLVASLSDSKLAVEVSVEGEQRPLPPTVDVSAYRIVQEALTNTLKHAAASRADVHLRYRPDELELEIIDDGRQNGAPASASASRAGGLGLVGMRERAALHGGQLTAGPAASGGFAVRVRLPAPAGAL